MSDWYGIEQAAIRIGPKLWTLPRPARHSDVLEFCRTLTGKDLYRVQQGFMTKSGRFVGRRVAALIARDARQIEAVKRTDPQDELFTEDLW